MSTLMHILMRPLRLRVKGLSEGRVAWQTLTTTTTTTTLHRRHQPPTTTCGSWTASGVRWCSGPTSYTQHSSITRQDDVDNNNNNNNNNSNEILGPQQLSKPHESPRPGIDDILEPQHLSEPLERSSPPNFLLPSQQKRYESDLLTRRIRESNSVSDVLGVYCNHREVMEVKHCLDVVKRLAEVVTNSSEEATHVLHDEDFKRLCVQLFSQCRRMDVEEVMLLFKCLCRIKVPPTSRLMQAVLQMIKHQINDLSLNHLIVLDFLLKKMTLTPISDALLTAIPILFTNTLANSSSGSEVKEIFFHNLTKALNICCQGKVEGAGIILQEMYRRGSVRSVPQAMSVVWTLTKLSSDLNKRLLDRESQLARDVIMKECLENLTQNIDSFSLQQVETTINNLREGYEVGDRSCYNERFLQASTTYVCRHAVPFEKTAHAVKNMLNMNYLPDELVQYMADDLLSTSQDISQARIPSLPVIAAIAAAPLPASDKAAALDAIMTNKAMQMDSEYYYKKPLVSLAQELLSVNYYHPQLIDLLTSPNTLRTYMSRLPEDNSLHCRLVEVDQALGHVVDSPHRVPEEFLEPGRKLYANKRPFKSNLKSMLKHILHDTDCLVSGVVTEGGLYIHHLLALDPEGVPISLKANDDPLQRNPSITSLGVPHNATKLAILDIGSGSVYRPQDTPKGPTRLLVRILEAQGYRVVPVLQSVVFLHHEEEKLLYVKKKLTMAGAVLS